MSEDRLSQTFEALAAPTRRAILARLGQGPATVGELAAPFEMSLPAISRHLKVLERAGLIRRERRAQWRRCHLEPGPLEEAAEWIEQHRDVWRARFDALARHLAAAQPQAETEEEESDAGPERLP